MKFKVGAAIEGDARLQRMDEIAQRAIPRLQPHEPRPGIVNICGYGPSLVDTWFGLSSPFICTTSGAHDFLLDRGILPTWHVEYDPRPHKVEFLRRATDYTNYCLASTCNPAMFDLVVSKKVLLWHALGPDVTGDATLIYKHEEDGILLLGGSNAGARAIMVMHCFGFRCFDLHGMDCSYRNEQVWAGPHTGKQHQMFEVECNGRKFFTSDLMINSCEEIWKTMFVQLADCQFRVAGDGLLAERLKLALKDKAKAFGNDWWRFTDPELAKRVVPLEVDQVDMLITDKYSEQNTVMHEWNANYGAFSGKYADQVREMAAAMDTMDILDYGCGKRKLEEALGFCIHNYDPAVPGCRERPMPADLVVCTDVLEHIEPQCIDAVLRDLQRVTKKRLLVAIATTPATKTLPDGRNAHLLVRSAAWWQARLAKYFWPLSHHVTANEYVGVYAEGTEPK